MIHLKHAYELNDVFNRAVKNLTLNLKNQFICQNECPVLRGSFIVSTL